MSCGYRPWACKKQDGRPAWWTYQRAELVEQNIGGGRRAAVLAVTLFAFFLLCCRLSCRVQHLVPPAGEARQWDGVVMKQGAVSTGEPHEAARLVLAAILHQATHWQHSSASRCADTSRVPQ